MSDTGVVRTIVRRDKQSVLNDVQLHPLLKRIFEHRGVKSGIELEHKLVHLPTPEQLKDIETATDILLNAIDSQSRILIIGDYDADGATSSAVAILGLKMLGVENIDYLVPNRFDFGYGLSTGIAEVALTMTPDLVVTVDNGISSIEGVQLLKDNNVRVIVTDHHLPAKNLPEADAIVNPNQKDCQFSSKMLAGVGVMFYVLLALRSKMRTLGRFADQPQQPNLGVLLDLVALGTAADLVPLDHCNRVLVAQGVARIQQGKCRPGIRALLNIAGKDYQFLSSNDLGFAIAPRLNAAGRLQDMSIGIECLLTDDDGEARQLAAALHEVNNQRKELELDMQQQAMAIVDRVEAETKAQCGLCLFDASWHQGITGLIASRLKDRYFQPTIVFAQSSGNKLSGSARSISGLHIRDLLESVSVNNSGLIEKFGGHAMAAGLTITEDNFKLFKKVFTQAVKHQVEDQLLENLILSDGELEAEFFTEEIAVLIRQAAPWGQSFQAPVFDNEFTVVNQRVVGQQHLKLTLRVGNKKLEAIAFRQLVPGQTMPSYKKIRAVYQLDINEFRGIKTLQLIIQHIQPVADEERVH